MNKFFVTVFFAIALSSCTALNTIYLGHEIKDLSSTKSDIRPVSLSFETGDDAWKWVENNIKYENDHGNKLQSPQETIERKVGVCRDYALLLGVLLRNCGETDIQFCTLYKSNGQRHAILKWNGQFIEPMRYRMVYDIKDSDIEAFYTIDQILDVCAMNGSRSINLYDLD